MVVVIDSSAPGRVARFRPAWRKCMTMTRRPTSTIEFIGQQATNTIVYQPPWGSSLSCTNSNAVGIGPDIQGRSVLFSWRTCREQGGRRVRRTIEGIVKEF